MLSMLTIRKTFLGSAFFVAAILFTGCGGNSTSKPTEESPSVATTDTHVKSMFEVPSDFPRAAVPLPDFEMQLVNVETTNDSNGKIWTLSWIKGPSGEPRLSSCLAYHDELKAKFPETEKIDSDGEIIGFYRDARYEVTTGCKPSAGMLITVKTMAE